MKIVTLELGGKSYVTSHVIEELEPNLTQLCRPALIFDDAHIDNAVEHTSTNFLRNSGQVCFASSRILVQEGIADKYVEGVKKSDGSR